MMAYKLNITNPQEYGLYVIKDSEGLNALYSTYHEFIYYRVLIVT